MRKNEKEIVKLGVKLREGRVGCKEENSTRKDPQLKTMGKRKNTREKERKDSSDGKMETTNRGKEK